MTRMEAEYIALVRNAKAELGFYYFAKCVNNVTNEWYVFATDGKKVMPDHRTEFDL